MKKVLFFAFITALSFFSSSQLKAQSATDGDYRSRATGTWSGANTWQVRSGASWANTATPPGSTNNVYIQTGHTVTVDVATGQCNDLHVHTGGVLAIGTNTIQVNGKIRAYTGTAVTATGADGTFYSGQTSSISPGANSITTGSGGELSFVGNSRNLTNTGEWGALLTGGEVEIALTAGQTGTLNTNFKARNWTMTSGILDANTRTISADNGAASTGTITISNGFVLISTATSVFQRTGSSSCASLTIASGATLRLGATSPTISALSITNNGTVEYNATGAQTLAVAANSGASPNTYTNLTISGNSTKTLGVSTTVNGLLTVSNGTLQTSTFNLTLNATTGSAIFGPTATLSINNAASTVNFNSRSVTLQSSSAGSARIAQIVGTLTAAGADNITVQRFISNQRAWRLLGIPFSTSSQTIKQAWMEGAANAATDPSPGFGTHITTFNGDANAANFDAEKPASSVRIFAGGTFSSDATHTPNTTTTITDYPAYFLYVRGDRAEDRTSNSNTSSTVLRATGTLITGATANGVNGGAGFVLVKNPYVSNVDFDVIKAANPGIQKFYVWIPGSNNYSAVTITDPGNDGIAPFDYNSNLFGANNSYRFIESGTAFFVDAADATSVNFTEASKSASNPPTSALREQSAEKSLHLTLHSIDGSNNTQLLDGAWSAFDESYSSSVGQGDAAKLEGFGLNLGIIHPSKILSIERRSLLNIDTIFYSLKNAALGNYQFQVNTSNFGAVAQQAFLEDAFTNTSTPLSLTTTTTYNFSITADVASQNENRFRIVFRESSTLPVNFTAIKAYQKNTAIQVEWNVSNESAIANYEVEKSIDGRSFTKAGSVIANGGTSYNWLDVAPVQGNNHYRVKSVGVNGEVKLTSVVNVKLGKGGAAVSVYPNPVKDNSISLQFANMVKGSYTVTLYNTAGQVMATKLVQHNGGSATEQMVLPTLAKGMYQLEVKGEASKSTQTIMIQ